MTCAFLEAQSRLDGDENVAMWSHLVVISVAIHFLPKV